MTLVPGRYYFSPPGTPFFSGPTLLGSRVWDPHNAADPEDIETLPPILGESRTARHRWDSGALPLTLPLEQSVGSSSCIADGELLAQALFPAGQVEGFPAACYVPATVPNPDYVFGFSVWECPTQLFWARACYLLSFGFYADAATWLGNRFTGATVTIVQRTTLYPAYAVIVHPSYCCAALAGTDNAAQALVEALQIFTGPQDYGQFSTGKLWYDFSTQVILALKNAGATDGRPIVLAGHSYGGVSSMLAGVRFALGIPGRQVRYLTYGSPKPGDARLRALLELLTEGVSLVVDGDLVAALPPTNDQIAALADLIPPPLSRYIGWTQWVYPPETTLMVRTLVLKNRYQVLDSLSLSNYIRNVWATGEIASLPAHAITTYVSTIAQRCPELFPVDWGEVLAFIDQVPIEPGEVLGMDVDQPPPRGWTCTHGDSGGTRVGSLTWSFGPYANPGFHVILIRAVYLGSRFQITLDGVAPTSGAGTSVLMGSYNCEWVGWLVAVPAGSGTHTVSLRLNTAAWEWVQWYSPSIGPLPVATWSQQVGTSSVPTLVQTVPSDPIGARFAALSIENDSGGGLWTGMIAACLQKSDTVDSIQLVGNYSGLVPGGSSAGTYTYTVGGTASSWAGIVAFVP